MWNDVFAGAARWGTLFLIILSFPGLTNQSGLLVASHYYFFTIYRPTFREPFRIFTFGKCLAVLAHLAYFCLLYMYRGDLLNQFLINYVNIYALANVTAFSLVELTTLIAPFIGCNQRSFILSDAFTFIVFTLLVNFHELSRALLRVRFLRFTMGWLYCLIYGAADTLVWICVIIPCNIFLSSLVTGTVAAMSGFATNDWMSFAWLFGRLMGVTSTLTYVLSNDGVHCLANASLRELKRSDTVSAAIVTGVVFTLNPWAYPVFFAIFLIQKFTNWAFAFLLDKEKVSDSVECFILADNVRDQRIFAGNLTKARLVDTSYWDMKKLFEVIYHAHIQERTLLTAGLRCNIAALLCHFLVAPGAIQHSHKRVIFLRRYFGRDVLEGYRMQHAEFLRSCCRAVFYGAVTTINILMIVDKARDTEFSVPTVMWARHLFMATGSAPMVAGGAFYLAYRLLHAALAQDLFSSPKQHYYRPYYLITHADTDAIVRWCCIFATFIDPFATLVSIPAVVVVWHNLLHAIRCCERNTLMTSIHLTEKPHFHYNPNPECFGLIDTGRLNRGFEEVANRLNAMFPERWQLIGGGLLGCLRYGSVATRIENRDVCADIDMDVILFVPSHNVDIIRELLITTFHDMTGEYGHRGEGQLIMELHKMQVAKGGDRSTHFYFPDRKEPVYKLLIEITVVECRADGRFRWGEGSSSELNSFGSAGEWNLVPEFGSPGRLRNGKYLVGRTACDMIVDTVPFLAKYKDGAYGNPKNLMLPPVKCSRSGGAFKDPVVPYSASFSKELYEKCARITRMGYVTMISLGLITEDNLSAQVSTYTDPFYDGSFQFVGKSKQIRTKADFAHESLQFPLFLALLVSAGMFNIWIVCMALCMLATFLHTSSYQLQISVWEPVPLDINADIMEPAVQLLDQPSRKQLCFYEYGTRGDVNNMTLLAKNAARIGYETETHRPVSYQRGIQDLKNLENLNMLPAVVSVGSVMADMSSKMANAGTIISNSSFPSISCDRLTLQFFDMARVRTVTLQMAPLDLVLPLLSSGTTADIRFAAGDMSVPHSGDGVNMIYRRVCPPWPRKPYLVVTGSSSVDASKLEGYKNLVYDQSCGTIPQDAIDEGRIETDPRHHITFLKYDTIISHGGQGTSTVANAAGCSFISISEAIDRRQRHPDTTPIQHIAKVEANIVHLPCALTIKDPKNAHIHAFALFSTGNMILWCQYVLTLVVAATSVNSIKTLSTGYVLMATLSNLSIYRIAYSSSFEAMARTLCLMVLGFATHDPSAAVTLFHSFGLILMDPQTWAWVGSGDVSSLSLPCSLIVLSCVTIATGWDYVHFVHRLIAELTPFRGADEGEEVYLCLRIVHKYFLHTSLQVGNTMYDTSVATSDETNMLVITGFATKESELEYWKIQLPVLAREFCGPPSNHQNTLPYKETTICVWNTLALLMRFNARIRLSPTIFAVWLLAMFEGGLIMMARVVMRMSPNFNVEFGNPPERETEGALLLPQERAERQPYEVHLLLSWRAGLLFHPSIQYDNVALDSIVDLESETIKTKIVNVPHHAFKISLGSIAQTFSVPLDFAKESHYGPLDNCVTRARYLIGLLPTTRETSLWYFLLTLLSIPTGAVIFIFKWLNKCLPLASRVVLGNGATQAVPVSDEESQSDRSSAVEGVIASEPSTPPPTPQPQVEETDYQTAVDDEEFAELVLPSKNTSRIWSALFSPTGSTRAYAANEHLLTLQLDHLILQSIEEDGKVISLMNSLCRSGHGSSPTDMDKYLTYISRLMNILRDRGLIDVIQTKVIAKDSHSYSGEASKSLMAISVALGHFCISRNFSGMKSNWVSNASNVENCVRILQFVWDKVMADSNCISFDRSVNQFNSSGYITENQDTLSKLAISVGNAFGRKLFGPDFMEMDHAKYLSFERQPITDHVDILTRICTMAREVDMPLRTIPYDILEDVANLLSSARDAEKPVNWLTPYIARTSEQKGNSVGVFASVGGGGTTRSRLVIQFARVSGNRFENRINTALSTVARALSGREREAFTAVLVESLVCNRKVVSAIRTLLLHVDCAPNAHKLQDPKAEYYWPLRRLGSALKVPLLTTYSTKASNANGSQYLSPFYLDSTHRAGGREPIVLVLLPPAEFTGEDPENVVPDGMRALNGRVSKVAPTLYAIAQRRRSLPYLAEEEPDAHNEPAPFQEFSKYMTSAKAKQIVRKCKEVTYKLISYFISIIENLLTLFVNLFRDGAQIDYVALEPKTRRKNAHLFALRQSNNKESYIPMIGYSNPMNFVMDDRYKSEYCLVKRNSPGFGEMDISEGDSALLPFTIPGSKHGTSFTAEDLEEVYIRRMEGQTVRVGQKKHYMRVDRNYRRYLNSNPNVPEYITRAEEKWIRERGATESVNSLYTFEPEEVIDDLKRYQNPDPIMDLTPDEVKEAGSILKNMFSEEFKRLKPTSIASALRRRLPKVSPGLLFEGAEVFAVDKDPGSQEDQDKLLLEIGRHGYERELGDQIQRESRVQELAGLINHVPHYKNEETGESLSFSGGTKISKLGKIRKVRDLFRFRLAPIVVAMGMEDLRSKFLAPTLNHTFVKSYKYPKYRYDESGVLLPPRIRTVVAEVLPQFLGGKAIYQELDNRVTARGFENNSSIGLSMTGVPWNEKFEKFKATYLKMGVDLSEADARQFQKLDAVLGSAIGEGFNWLGDEIGDHMDAQTAARIARLREGYIRNVYNQDVIVKLIGGATGDNFVTFKNVCNTLITTSKVISKALGVTMTEFADMVVIEIIGDDAMIGFKKNVTLTREQVKTASDALHAAVKVTCMKEDPDATRDLSGLDYTRHKFHKPEEFLDQFRKAGIEPGSNSWPKHAICYDADILKRNQTSSTLHRPRLTTYYDSKIGSLRKAMHHLVLFDQLYQECVKIREDLRRAGYHDYIKRRPVPTHEDLLQQFYVEIPKRRAARGTRLQAWTSFLSLEKEWYAIVSMLLVQYRASALNRLCGERLIYAGGAQLLPDTYGVEDHIMKIARPKTSRELSTIANTCPFASVCRAEIAWNERVKYPIRADTTGRVRIIMITFFYLAINYCIALCRRIIVLRELVTLYEFAVVESASHWGAISIVTFIAIGKGDPSLANLVGKDPTYVIKWLSLWLESIFPRPLTWLIYHGYLWDVLFDLLKRASIFVRGRSARAICEMNRTQFKIHSAWNDALHRLDAIFTKAKEATVVAACGTGKSQVLSKHLLTKYARVIYVFPRNLAAQNSYGFDYVSATDDIDPNSNLVSMTYGSFMSRLESTTIDLDDTIVVVSEFHESVPEMYYIVKTLRELDKPFICESATPSFGVMKRLGLRIEAIVQGPMSTNYPVKREIEKDAGPFHAVIKNLCRLDEGMRMLVMVVEEREAIKLTEMLIAASIDASTLSRQYSLKETRVIVSTLIAKTSITIPNLQVVICTGEVMSDHLGQTLRHTVNENDLTQIEGRTGRTCPGLMITLREPIAFESIPYPSWQTFCTDPSHFCEVFNITQDISFDGVGDANCHLAPGLVINPAVFDSSQWNRDVLDVAARLVSESSSPSGLNENLNIVRVYCGLLSQEYSPIEVSTTRVAEICRRYKITQKDQCASVIDCCHKLENSGHPFHIQINGQNHGYLRAHLANGLVVLNRKPHHIRSMSDPWDFFKMTSGVVGPQIKTIERGEYIDVTRGQFEGKTKLLADFARYISPGVDTQDPVAIRQIIEIEHLDTMLQTNMTNPQVEDFCRQVADYTKTTVILHWCPVHDWQATTFATRAESGSKSNINLIWHGGIMRSAIVYKRAAFALTMRTSRLEGQPAASSATGTQGILGSAASKQVADLIGGVKGQFIDGVTEISDCTYDDLLWTFAEVSNVASFEYLAGAKTSDECFSRVIQFLRTHDPKWLNLKSGAHPVEPDTESLDPADVQVLLNEARRKLISAKFFDEPIRDIPSFVESSEFYSLLCGTDTDHPVFLANLTSFKNGEIEILHARPGKPVDTNAKIIVLGFNEKHIQPLFSPNGMSRASPSSALTHLPARSFRLDEIGLYFYNADIVSEYDHSIVAERWKYGILPCVGDIFSGHKLSENMLDNWVRRASDHLKGDKFSKRTREFLRNSNNCCPHYNGDYHGAREETICEACKAMIILSEFEGRPIVVIDNSIGGIQEQPGPLGAEEDTFRLYNDENISVIHYHGDGLKEKEPICMLRDPFGDKFVHYIKEDFPADLVCLGKNSLRLGGPTPTHEGWSLPEKENLPVIRRWSPTWKLTYMSFKINPWYGAQYTMQYSTSFRDNFFEFNRQLQVHKDEGTARRKSEREVRFASSGGLDTTDPDGMMLEEEIDQEDLSSSNIPQDIWTPTLPNRKIRAQAAAGTLALQRPHATSSQCHFAE